MQFSFWWVAGLVAAIAALHFWGVYAGIYEAQIERGVVWFDNVLHFFVGIAFGLAWMWFAGEARLFSTFMFVFMLALVWELSEFALLFFAPDFAHTFKLYSTSLDEAVLDILSDLLGAVLLFFVLTAFRSKIAAQ